MKAQKVKLNLWQIRTDKAISIPELVERTGIGKSSLYNYENNKTSPPLEALYKIAVALDVPMHELYYIAEKE